MTQKKLPVLVIARVKVKGRNKYRLVPKESANARSLDNMRTARLRAAVTSKDVPESVLQVEYKNVAAAQAAAEGAGCVGMTYQALAYAADTNPVGRPGRV